jgi:hypothetical protein
VVDTAAENWLARLVAILSDGVEGGAGITTVGDGWLDACFAFLDDDVDSWDDDDVDSVEQGWL